MTWYTFYSATNFYNWRLLLHVGVVESHSQGVQIEYTHLLKTYNKKEGYVDCDIYSTEDMVH